MNTRPLCPRTLAIWKRGEALAGVHCSYAYSGKMPNTGRLVCHLCGRDKPADPIEQAIVRDGVTVGYRQYSKTGLLGALSFTGYRWL